MNVASSEPRTLTLAHVNLRQDGVLDSTTPDPITLTDSAVRRLRALQATGQHTHMRLGVRGGGCAGYSYTFALDSAFNEASDIEIVRDGARVVLDRLSLAMIKGSTLDYGESLLEAGFRVLNPNAESSCGCGVSFSLADEESA